MSIDAMKQALAALEWALDFIPPESETDCECPLCKAHDALTEAIEQAERVKRAEEAFAAASEEMKGEQAERQEPVCKYPTCGCEKVNLHAMQGCKAAPPQRQPSGSFVAWNNILCNPLAPAEKQNLSAWEDGYASGMRRLHEVEGRYHELLYAVGNKYEGESRHQTALRYIQQSEVCDSAAAKEKT